ncbi:MAG: threonine ammonia-lyase [Planctomycetes bacterium]|nr:threonine ammonia-lyase [Planctomycetota bacterium]
MKVTFDDILAAAERLRGGVYESPCPPSEPLSLATGCKVWCKLDYLQRTGSFKERGARNALLLLSQAERGRGVVAASAGNHALGLAYHGKLLGVPVTVVMPRFAPLTKVSNCQQLGARVILAGDDLDAARAEAAKLVESEGLRYIHGFNDPEVIAGQGTLGLEIVAQVPDLEAVLVPVGGAGLIAGVALAVKTLRPGVKVIGVEPSHAASLTAALKAGRPVPVPVTPTLADGLAVSQVGANAFEIARQYVDRVVVVSERSLALAVLRLAELEKSVVEGAGAASLAALLEGLAPELKGKRVVLPLCGGNIDTPVLGRIIERGLAADGRLCRFVARISDRPGGLAGFATVIAQEGASIRDIEHDRTFSGEDLASVNVYCVVETRDFEHAQRLRERLTAQGYRINVPPSLATAGEV